MYSLRKSKAILFHYASRFKRKKRELNTSQKDQIQGILSSLQEAILEKNRRLADQLAKKLDHLSKNKLKKNTFQQIRDVIFALLFAIIVAVLFRGMWFEFYEIPSGSMRPTFKEQDRLVVSKTDFGINIPLRADHFYFDPNLVQRNSTLIFTGENMDIRDVDTRYFYLFPGKKQYIKRLIGKPGDTLYFYGGAIYGIDKKGRELTNELQPQSLRSIEHIPFIRFEGKAITPQFPMQGLYSPVILHQMNEAIAKLYLTPTHQVKGEMLVPDVSDYGDLWGIKNFAMARLLTKEQVKQLTNEIVSELHDAELYLELRHSPSLHSLRLGRDQFGRYRPIFNLSKSIIPLNHNHLEVLFHNLYTARFVVKNGFARRWGSTKANTLFLPHFSGIPDGTYEFYNGKATKILWGGITKELPQTHPLLQFNVKRLQQLFNVGIEFSMHFDPDSKHQSLYPARYAYFKDGDFYLMGKPLLQQSDPILQDFIKRERAKAFSSHGLHPYLPFIDAGPPLNNDGILNVELIKRFGLKIPPKMYLALGDNHAMSSDSREFGFVPEDNLRGSADFIFWPPGSRWGRPLQVPYPFITFPRLIIWALVTIILIGWGIVHHKRKKLPLN